MVDRLVAANVFDVDGDTAVLIGGKCADCGNVAFPLPTGCARCTGTAVTSYRLAIEGELWTYTVQAFRPKPPYDGPAEFEPFGVGYVDLGGEVLVEGWLTGIELDAIEIGRPMRSVTKAYKTDASGDAVLTYAFAPKEA